MNNVIFGQGHKLIRSFEKVADWSECLDENCLKNQAKIMLFRKLCHYKIIIFRISTRYEPIARSTKPFNKNPIFLSLSLITLHCCWCVYREGNRLAPVCPLY